MNRHRIFVGKDVHKFSSAHMSLFPDGSKERLHGHNFRVSVTLDLVDISSEHMVDFAIIKQAIEAQCKTWHERLLLPGKAKQLRILQQDPTSIDFELCGKRYVIPSDEALVLDVDNVVVETLAFAFAEALKPRLSGCFASGWVTAVEVTVTESDGQGGSYAWSVSRNV